MLNFSLAEPRVICCFRKSSCEVSVCRPYAFGVDAKYPNSILLPTEAHILYRKSIFFFLMLVYVPVLIFWRTCFCNYNLSLLQVLRCKTLAEKQTPLHLYSSRSDRSRLVAQYKSSLHFTHLFQAAAWRNPPHNSIVQLRVSVS